ncbi:MAG TPA: hypothetical protein DEH78_09825 [Solibacterales bacterium]|nr:hypothetical protein [Bryobacterales bacterium]
MQSDCLTTATSGPTDSDPAIADRFSSAFGALRRIAASLLRHERPGHTLQPTALVAEAFLRLRRLRSPANDQHFYHLAALAMKRTLIDYARARSAASRVALEDLPPLFSSVHLRGESGVALRTAVDRLKRLDPVAAETVWRRYAEGWTLEELAARQGREMWRVRADCDFALQWLSDRLA